MANEPLCPHFHDHMPQPHGWFQWWEWVAKMKKTHKQTKCSGCGLWVIWIPKPAKEGK